MKYSTKEVLKGSKMVDRERWDGLKEKMDNCRFERQQILDSAQTDMEVLQLGLSELTDDLNKGSVLTQKEVQDAISVDVKGSRYSTTRILGLDKGELERATRRLQDAEDKYKAYKPSELTQFLETVDEEFVTDHGLKQAGFGDTRPGRLVVLARNE